MLNGTARERGTFDYDRIKAILGTHFGSKELKECNPQWLLEAPITHSFFSEFIDDRSLLNFKKTQDFCFEMLKSGTLNSQLIEIKQNLDI